MDKDYKTFCKDCCFYNIIDKSCKLGKIDKFKERNAEILEEENHIVINRLCPTFRPLPWKYNGEISEGRLFDELKSRFKYDVLIYIDKKCSFENICNSLMKQQIQPQKIIFINNLYNKDVTTFTRIKFSLQEIFDKSDISYIIEHIIEKDADRNRCIDIGIKRVKSPMYFAFNIDYTPKDDLSQNLFHQIINELHMFSLIKLDNENYISNTLLHKTIGGNRGKLSFIEKVETEAKLEQCQHMIKTQDFLQLKS